MRRDDRIRVQAAICSRFGVAWHLYGSLTLREHRVLLEALREEIDAEKAVSGDESGSTPEGSSSSSRIGRHGERLERVC